MWLLMTVSRCTDFNATFDLSRRSYRYTPKPNVPDAVAVLVVRWGNNGGREWRSGRDPKHSINFICAHDGFPLADLVMYNEKHNEANGEDNR